ncbi:unnamed protein product, partial [Hapterophycus canaliculatus]
AVEEAFPPGVEARAVVEGRFLSMRGRMVRMGIPRPSAVLATGGGTNSPAILQVLSDVFSAPVFLRTVPDAAAIGAALRAKHGYLCSSSSVSPSSSSPSSSQEEPRDQTNPSVSTGAGALVVSAAPAHGVRGEECSAAGAYIPFSEVLPPAGAAPDATTGTGPGATQDGDEPRAGGSRSAAMMRLAATPREDADAMYERMAER